MQLPPLNVNTVIIAILLSASFYGLVAGKQRLRILILSVYVGIVLAEQLHSPLASRLPMLEAGQVSWLLLGIPILVFGLLGIAHKKDHDRGTFIANLIVGLFTGALIISSALRLLPTSQMAAIDNESFIATHLQQFHIWILGLLPVVALLMGMMRGNEKKGRH
jgi:hypothetical protein